MMRLDWPFCYYNVGFSIVLEPKRSLEFKTMTCPSITAVLRGTEQG